MHYECIYKQIYPVALNAVIKVNVREATLPFSFFLSFLREVNFAPQEANSFKSRPHFEKACLSREAEVVFLGKNGKNKQEVYHNSFGTKFI